MRRTPKAENHGVTITARELLDAYRAHGAYLTAGELERIESLKGNDALPESSRAATNQVDD